MNKIFLIARTVLIEAIRRKEIYAIVLISVLIIGAIMTVDFFNLEGIEKFYREITLRVMSTATAITVIILAARQLPREFEKRTIYPLLAKPVSRVQFLFGKLTGVMMAALFCFAIFMSIYVIGVLFIAGEIPVVHFMQYIWLQVIMLIIVSTLSFWLSLRTDLDAAITIATLLYIFAQTLSSLFTFIYPAVPAAAQSILKVMIFVIPQLNLFDLSEKTVHADMWEPVGLDIMVMVTAYGLFYAAIFFGLALLSFRKKEL